MQQADLQDAPLKDSAADLVTMHQVLHFLEEPLRAVKEAARLLGEDGHILITDFAAHEFENYRDNYAHRRLGFSDTDMQQFLFESNFELRKTETILASDPTTPDVKIWYAVKIGELTACPRFKREKTQLPSRILSTMPTCSKDLIYCVTRG